MNYLFFEGNVYPLYAGKTYQLGSSVDSNIYLPIFENVVLEVLSKEALACGVIAASAGNHAQGVALSAQRLGCRAVIVMPETTPKIKIDAVKSRGGEVVLKGVSYNDAYDYAMELAEKEKLTYIAPLSQHRNSLQCKFHRTR